MALQFSSKCYENYELQFILYISILIKSNCDSRRNKFLKYLFQICHLLVIYNILIVLSLLVVAVLKQKVVQTSNLSFEMNGKNCVFVMPVLILFIIYQMYVSPAVYFMKICYISYITMLYLYIHLES